MQHVGRKDRITAAWLKALQVQHTPLKRRIVHVLLSLCICWAGSRGQLCISLAAITSTHAARLSQRPHIIA